MKNSENSESYPTNIKLLINANIAYRAGDPVISDADYDEFYKLVKLEYPDHEVFKSAVLESPKKNRKEELQYPMFSLDKLQSFEELQKWQSKNKLLLSTVIVITGKYDAVSLQVEEKTGRAYSRGDGEIGQDCTPHYLSMADPTSLKGVTAGEYIMKESTFNENLHRFKKQDPPYANARNMMAGLINSDEVSVDLQYADYVRYIVFDDQMSKEDQIKTCNKYNTIKIPYIKTTFEDLFELGAEWLSELYFKWDKAPYKIDGLVIDINDSEIRGVLGRETNNNPKYARAYKAGFEDVKETVVKSIEWNVSKDGLIKPVIHIEPTHLAGVIVRKASGYNARYIIDSNIAKDSVIEIKRSGDVIPKHLKTIDYNSFEVNILNEDMKQCPSCGNLCQWTENNKGENVDLICYVDSCKQKLIRETVHFFKTIGVEEFGEPSVIKCFDANLECPTHIIYASEDDLLSIDGFAEKSVTSLRKEIREKLTNIKLSKIADAFNTFKGMGEKTLDLITSNMDEQWMLDLQIMIKNERVEEEVFENLIKIDGIGEITARAFLAGIEPFLLKVDLIKDNFNIITREPELELINESLLDKVFVFSKFRNDELKFRILERGGKIASGISKKVTHLVVADFSVETSKMTKAKKLSIPIISIKELEELIF